VMTSVSIVFKKFFSLQFVKCCPQSQIWAKFCKLQVKNFERWPQRQSLFV